MAMLPIIDGRIVLEEPMNMSERVDASQTARLIRILGVAQNDRLTLNYKTGNMEWQAPKMPARDVPKEMSKLNARSDIYLCLNALSPGADRKDRDSIIKVNAMSLDIDVDPEKVKTEEHALQIIDAISTIVGQRPRAIVKSGGGFHPHWVVDSDTPWSDVAAERSKWHAIQERWILMAKQVAMEVNGSTLDKARGIERVWRAPGSYNNKDIQNNNPRPVYIYEENEDSDCLSYEELDEALKGYGVEEAPTRTGSLFESSGRMEFSEMPEYVQDRVRKYIENALTQSGDALRLLDGDPGSQWDNTCVVHSRRLVELANSPWNGLSLEDAHSVLLSNMPTDKGFPESRVQEKWEGALKHKNGEGAAAPYWLPGELEFAETVAGAEGGTLSRFDFEVAEYVHKLKIADQGRAKYNAYKLAERSANDKRERVVSGGEFILNVPDVPPAIWGNGSQIVWIEGEALLIVASDGLGKTTLAQQLILSYIGVHKPEFLEMEVKPLEDGKKVLYLASDRPDQIARSFARMVTASDKELLNERLVMWRGPVPIEISESPSTLADWIEHTFGNDIGAVVVDSYKDLVPELEKGERANYLNSAMQEVLERGIQWLGLHHNKKLTQGETQVKISDIFGSRHITSGVGSILIINGMQGEPLVTMSHAKIPAEKMSDMMIRHDGPRGVSERVVPNDNVIGLLDRAGAKGSTKAELAQEMYGDSKAAAQGRVQRQLDTAKDNGLVVSTGGGRGGSGGSRAVRWFGVDHAPKGV